MHAVFTHCYFCTCSCLAHGYNCTFSRIFAFARFAAYSLLLLHIFFRRCPATFDLHFLQIFFIRFVFFSMSAAFQFHNLLFFLFFFGFWLYFWRYTLQVGFDYYFFIVFFVVAVVFMFFHHKGGFVASFLLVCIFFFNESYNNSSIDR